jgi:ubiquinone/menaquinone biosynthesis C-methylase UbiE
MSVNASFDSLAANYDADFTHSLIGKMQRKLVWKHTQNELKNDQNLDILEINCGTGEDAIWLASQHHRVLATDISSKMILIAQKKTAQFHTQIQTEVIGFNQLLNKLENKKFDVIFSNFGGLNCADEKQLKQLNNDFCQLLKPKGKLIMVLLAQKCLIEKLYFLFKLDFRKINRRNQVNAAYLSPNNHIQTWYYNSQDIHKIFNQFNIIQKKPIGLFIPPSYLEVFVKKFNFILLIIKPLEAIFANYSLFANYGDHIFLTLKKKE